MKNKTIYCRDYPDRPGCLGIADPLYTMRFDDIGEEPLYWCASCGAEAHKINAALNDAFEERGEEFVQELEEAVNKAKRNTN